MEFVTHFVYVTIFISKSAGRNEIVIFISKVMKSSQKLLVIKMYQ